MERTLSNRRRYLTENELGKLINAARKGRYGRRDATLMLLMARHGLRVTESIDLRWDQIDFLRSEGNSDSKAVGKPTALLSSPLVPHEGNTARLGCRPIPPRSNQGRLATCGSFFAASA